MQVYAGLKVKKEYLCADYLTSDMHDLYIRKATIDDVPLLARVVAAAVGFCDFDRNESDEQKHRYAVMEEICAMDDTLYSYRNAVVGVVDGVAIGCIVCYPGELYAEGRKRTWAIFDEKYGASSSHSEAETQAGEYYLDSGAIIPEYRRYGYFKAMLRHCVRMGQELGYDRVTLIVLKEHDRLHDYYASVGFSDESEMVFMDEDYIKMVYSGKD